SDEFRNETLAFLNYLLYGSQGYETEQSRFGRRGRPSPLVDAGRPLPVAAYHRARQHDPQRRAALAAARSRRLVVAAAVDRRRVHARVRRRAADGGVPGRPLRGQGWA